MEDVEATGRVVGRGWYAKPLVNYKVSLHVRTQLVVCSLTYSWCRLYIAYKNIQVYIQTENKIIIIYPIFINVFVSTQETILLDGNSDDMPWIINCL